VADRVAPSPWKTVLLLLGAVVLAVVVRSVVLPALGCPT
jgi:hypothetical protein